MAQIVQSLPKVYAFSRVFALLLEHGLKSKVAKTRQGTLDELASLLKKFGLAACDPPKAFPQVASMISDKDPQVRKSALAVLRYVKVEQAQNTHSIWLVQRSVCSRRRIDMVICWTFVAQGQDSTGRAITPCVRLGYAGEGRGKCGTNTRSSFADGYTEVGLSCSWTGIFSHWWYSQSRKPVYPCLAIRSTYVPCRHRSIGISGVGTPIFTCQVFQASWPVVGTRAVFSDWHRSSEEPTAFQAWASQVPLQWHTATKICRCFSTRRGRLRRRSRCALTQWPSACR